MTQEELTHLGTLAVQELDLDFHLESASQHDAHLVFVYSNRHADPADRTFEAEVDLDQVGGSLDAAKRVLRQRIEFAGHPFGKH